MVPPEGAYAAWVKWDGNILPGVLGIVKAKEGVIEAHLFNLQKDIYGLQLEVIFIERMRGRMFFSDRKEAKEQIERDAQEAREILTQSPLYKDSIP